MALSSERHHIVTWSPRSPSDCYLIAKVVNRALSDRLRAPPIALIVNLPISCAPWRSDGAPLHCTGVALALRWRSRGASQISQRWWSSCRCWRPQYQVIWVEVLNLYFSDMCCKINFINKCEYVRYRTPILKRICFHFYEIVVTGCTESCHFDNFRCRQW